MYSDKVIASQGKRFANYLIDYAAKFILSFSFFFIVASLDGIFGDGSIAFWLSEINKVQELFIGYIFVLVYYMFMETITPGRTIGKYITKTKVVTLTGERPQAESILKRTFSRMIPFDAFSFLEENPRGWHDNLSETVVVDVKKFEEEKQLKNSFDQIGTEVSE